MLAEQNMHSVCTSCESALIFDAIGCDDDHIFAVIPRSH